MKIEIRKPTSTEIEQMGIKSWPIWEKEKSTFPWFYDDKETCLILEGRVKVKTDFEEVEFGTGDLVVFPKNLKCTWQIIEDVRKHYNFG